MCLNMPLIYYKTRNKIRRELKMRALQQCTVADLISIPCNHEASYNGGCSRMVSDFLQIFLCGVF